DCRPRNVEAALQGHHLQRLEVRRECHDGGLGGGVETKAVVAHQDRTSGKCRFMATPGCVVPDASSGIPMGERTRGPRGERTVRSTRDGGLAPAQSAGGPWLREQTRNRRRPPRHTTPAVTLTPLICGHRINVW